MIDESIIDKLENVIDAKASKRQGAKTTTGTVTKIENNVIWVQVENSTTQTPCASSTVEVKPGQIVMVEISDGTARITGNISNPSTDDTVALEARDAASSAREMADDAEKVAQEARDVAQATGQHFWHDDSGAHVTTQTRAEYESNPDGYNSLWNSLGMLFRKAANNLVSITQSAIAFFDGEGNDDGNIVARFGSDGVQIGKTNESHMTMGSRSMQIVDMDGDVFLDARDTRDDDGRTLTSRVFIAAEGETSFGPIHAMTEFVSVEVDGTQITSGFTVDLSWVFFDTAPAAGSRVKITFYADRAFHTFAFGEDTSVYGDNSAAFGSMLQSYVDNQLVCGERNERDDDAVFIVGCGDAAENPAKNAFVVRKYGVTVAPILAADEGDYYRPMSRVIQESHEVTIGSVAGNGTKWLDIDVAKDGYQAIAINGWYVNGAATCYPYSMFFEPGMTRVTVALKNASSSVTNASATLRVYVTYM